MLSISSSQIWISLAIIERKWEKCRHQFRHFSIHPNPWHFFDFSWEGPTKNPIILSVTIQTTFPFPPRSGFTFEFSGSFGQIGCNKSCSLSPFLTGSFQLQRCHGWWFFEGEKKQTPSMRWSNHILFRFYKSSLMWRRTKCCLSLELLRNLLRHNYWSISGPSTSAQLFPKIWEV